MNELFTETGLERLARTLEHVKGKRSYRKFAQTTSVSESSIRRLFNTETIPDLTTLHKIAQASEGQYTTSQLVAILTEEFKPPSIPNLIESLSFEEKAEIMQRLSLEEKVEVIQSLSFEEKANLIQSLFSKLDRATKLSTLSALIHFL